MYGGVLQEKRPCAVMAARTSKKRITAQLGIEPRPPTLCLRTAGTYIVGVIPLDHCALFEESTRSA